MLELGFKNTIVIKNKNKNKINKIFVTISKYKI